MCHLRHEPLALRARVHGNGQSAGNISSLHMSTDVIYRAIAEELLPAQDPNLITIHDLAQAVRQQVLGEGYLQKIDALTAIVASKLQLDVDGRRQTCQEILSLAFTLGTDELEEDEK